MGRHPEGGEWRVHLRHSDREVPPPDVSERTAIPCANCGVPVFWDPRHLLNHAARLARGHHAAPACDDDCAESPAWDADRLTRLILDRARWEYHHAPTHSDDRAVGCDLMADGEILASCLWSNGDLDVDSDGCGVMPILRDIRAKADDIEWPDEAEAMAAVWGDEAESEASP